MHFQRLAVEMEREDAAGTADRRPAVRLAHPADGIFQPHIFPKERHSAVDVTNQERNAHSYGTTLPAYRRVPSSARVLLGGNISRDSSTVGR